MSAWTSTPIHIDGIDLQVSSSVDGVTVGRTIDGVYASDLLLTPEQAMEIAEALTEGAAKCLSDRGEA